MNESRRGSMGIMVAVAAVVLVLAFLLALFAVSGSSGRSTGIVLPDASAGKQEAQPESYTPEGSFVQVTPDNVIAVLETIHRAEAYQQVYQVTVGSEAVSASRAVHLWVNGDLIHADLYDTTQDKTVLTDGETVYVWYGDDPDSVAVLTDAAAEPADLFGLLTYEQLIHTDPADIIRADYLVLESAAQVQCIYVECRDDEDTITRYWISLYTGLLFRAEVEQAGEIVYNMEQSRVTILAPDDAAFSKRFLLPNGFAPFTA